MARKGLVGVACAVVAVWVAFAGAARAGSLGPIAEGVTPAASDGGQYAVWLDRDGHLVVHDSVRLRSRVYGRICAGTRPAWSRVRAGAGIAAIQCVANGVPRNVVVRLRTGEILPLALPRDAPVSVIGRYWIGSGFVRPEVYVRRATGEVRYNVDALVPPLLNPDSRNLSQLPPRPGVARLLYSGMPLTGAIGPGIVVRDPRLRRDTRVVKVCAMSCGPPFGRVGRLTYVQSTGGPVYVHVLRRNGQRSQRWEVPLRLEEPGASSVTESEYVIATLTSRELVVSVILGDGGYEIRATRVA